MFLTAGCTTTYQLGTPEEFDSVNCAHSATIHLKNSSNVCGRDIHAGRDSILLTDRCTDLVLSLPIRDVEFVEHIDRVSGAFLGFFVGSASGCLAGVAIAPELDGHHGNHIELGVGILGAAIGGGVGFIWGAVQGNRTRYEFPSYWMRTSTQNNSEPRK